MTDQDQRWFRRLDRWSAVAWRFIVVVLAIGLAAWLLVQLRIILVPSVFALFICTVLVPVKRLYLRLHIGGTAASLGAVLTGFAGIALVVLAMIPPVVDEWDELLDSISQAYDDIFTWLEEGPIGLSAEQVEDLRDNVEDAQDLLLDALASGALAGLPIFVEIVVGIFLAVVVSFFFLRDGDRMWQWAVGLLPTAEHERAHRAGVRAWRTLARYLRGMTVVALVDAIGIGIGAYLLDLPLVVPIAVLTFFTAFVPIVGAIAAGTVAVLIALADGGPSTALWMLLIVLIVQQVESNVVAPTVVGRSVDIHPIVVLFGVSAGGAIAGVLGAILVTPLIAVVAVLIKELLGDDGEPASLVEVAESPDSEAEPEPD